MIQTLFQDNNAVSQDDNTGTIHSQLEEHEHEFQFLPWPAKLQDLNITEPLWSVLETGVRNRFPPPTSLKQLEHVLQEECYKIPLETPQKLAWVHLKKDRGCILT
jgi:hypothetical protein